MRLLFIGGTGTISSACTQLAVERGMEVFLLNRGRTTSRPVPDGAHVLHADIRAPQTVGDVLGDRTFDVVVNWVAFEPEHVETDLELFAGRTGQYVFISSASAYQTPPSRLPVTESTPLRNPHWAYSRAKIACEDRLVRAYRAHGFPVTIVRPSHTYDPTIWPFHGGYTVVDRMRRGKPVVVHGDGTSLWVLTHHRDFARGFVGLLGRTDVLGEAVHITSDEALTWNQIYRTVARVAGVAADLVHVPSTTIARFDAEWGASLLGDKAHSMWFDNRKIKRLVPDFAASTPYAHGAAETLAWHDADPIRRTVDPRLDALMDRLVAAQRAVG